MDHSTQQLIDKFKRNPAIAQSLLQSGDGQRLMQMLTSQDGGAALNHAAQNAAAGNTKELATMLSNLMKSPEGMAIMNRINDMSEWEEKLNTLLSDPDAMAQVMNMAQNLSQQMGQSGGSAPPPPPAGGAAGPAPSAPTPPPPQGDPMGDLSSLLGGIDPGMIAKLLPVLSQLNRPESGETAAFLRALRPFLKPERQDKVERAAQLARFIHLGKTLLLSEGGPRNV